MTKAELKSRFRAFSIRIVKMVDKLPNTIAGRALGAQIIRSGTSPGANYNAACIAKSDRDFINKLKMVEEELDETIYWLDLIGATELIKPELLVELDKEAKELLSIIVKSIITKRKKLTASQL
ncbi:MAG: four helix bundle protein [Bacteroidales bacterium]|nr:four helix bundle protein [Bacteroidales bacterium]